ncbi:uncharacterized protein LOC133020572 [Limanda limanda]|uniref:uncharacterized protein LOC133020572 n=1 Tax=Limanda limanda TaxID=27771 RepID=UPI0029C86D40|nr:uncharacterized protein LOC133020572 [Limanda limanda]
MTMTHGPPLFTLHFGASSLPPPSGAAGVSSTSSDKVRIYFYGKMASKDKKHRAMGDEEWMSRLRRFAVEGAWPADAGNRPAPRQKKWHDLFLKIEKCPLQLRGQRSLFGGPQTCNCGFHIKKPSVSVSSSVTPQPGPSSASPSITPGQPLRKPPLRLESFTKPRFGGSHGALAQPNLASAWQRGIKTTTGTPSPGHSPRHYIQTVSPLSLPPSTVSATTSTSCVTSAATGARVSTAISLDTSSAPPAPVDSASDECVSSAATSVAGPSAHPTPNPEPLAAHLMSAAAIAASEPGWLPAKLKKTIPAQDQKWISAALWKNNRLRSDLKLWYDPPTPALIYHQVPAPERFFTHKLLVWMPYHLWKLKLSCPACSKQLTGYGAHKRCRKVLDVDRFYLLITETLFCSACKTSYISSSKQILDQLDMPTRMDFSPILTQRFAVDIRVLVPLRERALGNSPSRIVRQLRENHSRVWIQFLIKYFAKCTDFSERQGLLPLTFQEPPELLAIPSHRWMLTVYGRDILNRLDHIKASITCTFGSILKMDSTKKITKKLSGFAKGTALWLTSVSNEVGQILISVLTAQEGPALDNMAAGLIQRYKNAGVAPPKVLYVDCECCREGTIQTKLKQRFGGWPDLIVRLDIYHFMRRLASGCTKDAHPLYPTFMAKLSSCIFEWDSRDVALLRRAKRAQLAQDSVPGITDQLVDLHITKDELTMHCRRQTRGEQETITSIECLLNELMGLKGSDFLGVPLLDKERMKEIWRVQRRHVKCIQDVPGVLLYTQTGTTTKEGIVLPNYRCARGSTSLESFHLHVNRFIPGTSANSLNFQLYLLEGLNRWNQDRQTASLAPSLAGKPPDLLCYSGDLVQCANTYSLKVLGRKVVESFQPPSVYTGELIGIDYLYRQTGRALQDVRPDSEETDKMLEDVCLEEQLENAGLDPTQYDPTIELLDLSSDPSPTSSSTPSSLHTTASPPRPGCSSTAAASEHHLIQYEDPVPSAPPAGSSLSATISPALRAGPSGSPPVTAAVAQRALDFLTRELPGPSAVTTSSASMPSLHTTLSTTVPTATATASSASPTTTPAGPRQHLAVDERSVPGMDRVDCLADYLVELRTETGLTLTNLQASTIVALWQNLLPYDRQRVEYAARHKSRLLTGRYRCSKKRDGFTPGVESTTRCVLGSTGSPAQWPDCCRLIESIFIKLCSLYKSPKNQGSYSLTRWTLIINDYTKIRQLVLGNGVVMQDTALQLFEVNQTTLIQWHNKRLKRQECRILLQGVNLPPTIPVATVPLPPIQTRPTAAPLLLGPQHIYHLPQRTVGKAVDKRKSVRPPEHPLLPHPPKVVCLGLPALRQTHPPAEHPLLPQPPKVVCLGLPALRQTHPPAEHPLLPQPPKVVCLGLPALRQTHPPAVPLTTPSSGPFGFLPPKVPAFRLIAPAGPLPTPTARKRYRTGEKNKCGQCHQPRDPESGHHQYYGLIYCPFKTDMPHDQWLEDMRRKRAAKK